ncbi:unnamed protein product [Discosporangium mesarthrocarpum]
MERHVAGSNTSALLVAHNGLARLLKQHWRLILGGTLDAPELLSRLCHIYQDGLVQIQPTLSTVAAEGNKPATKNGARANSSTAARVGRSGEREQRVSSEEEAHLRKYSKLLATFGARVGSMLRYLGLECGKAMLKEAVLLLALVGPRWCGWNLKHCTTARTGIRGQVG